MDEHEQNKSQPHNYSELLNGKNDRADLRLSMAVMSAEASRRAKANPNGLPTSGPPIPAAFILFPKKAVLPVKRGLEGMENALRRTTNQRSGK